MNIKKILLVLFIFLCSLFSHTYAAINMTVSPIKYELEGNPGESITHTATLYNYDDTSVDIITGKSDFVADGTTGGPSFVRYSELVHDDQQISSWMSLSSSGFTIGPKTSYDIEFTVDIPENATPGGHYGAVFFKNNNSETTSGNAIGLNVDYGILVLLTVSGEINTEIIIEEPIITNNSSNVDNSSNGNSSSSSSSSSSSLRGGSSSNNNSNNNLNTNNTQGTPNNLASTTILQNPSQSTQNNAVAESGNDSCVFDFTSSNFDGKCFDNPIDFIDGKVNKTTLISNPDTTENIIVKKIDPVDENFGINFTFPIVNTGNTHVKPEGSITLVDENGTQIKGIGKQPIFNDKGAVEGTKIVDYIPINEGRGNVLPDSQRNFSAEWKGFPYETRDEEGKIVMADMSPNEYYTQKNIGDGAVMMPWERVQTKKNEKIVTAYIKMSYPNEQGEIVEYNSAKEIPVTYTENYIGLNPYIILPFILFGGIFILLWFIALGKRRKCINKDCKKRIKRRLKRCPHCDTKQSKFNTKKTKKTKK